MGVVLTFDGITSEELGLTVENMTGEVLPEKQFDTVEIPGGRTLVYDNENYLDYEQTYTLWWRRDTDKNRFVYEWLSKKGYKSLDDDTFPFHRRYAFIVPGTTFENRNGVIARSEITFHCKPFWYTLTGETPIVHDFTEWLSMNLYNPCEYSQPLMKIDAKDPNVETSITFQTGSRIRFTGDTITVDSEKLYVEAENNVDYKIENGFPIFTKGLNIINTSNVSMATIIPRWCDIVP